jgi:hypothetical protein
MLYFCLLCFGSMLFPTYQIDFHLSADALVSATGAPCFDAPSSVALAAA